MIDELKVELNTTKLGKVLVVNITWERNQCIFDSTLFIFLFFCSVMCRDMCNMAKVFNLRMHVLVMK
jgi:hypothetical protein